MFFLIFLKMYSKTQFLQNYSAFFIPFTHLKSYLKLCSPEVIMLLPDRIWGDIFVLFFLLIHFVLNIYYLYKNNKVI